MLIVCESKRYWVDFFLLKLESWKCLGRFYDVFESFLSCVWRPQIKLETIGQQVDRLGRFLRFTYLANFLLQNIFSLIQFSLINFFSLQAIRELRDLFQFNLNTFTLCVSTLYKAHRDSGLRHKSNKAGLKKKKTLEKDKSPFSVTSNLSIATLCTKMSKSKAGN